MSKIICGINKLRKNEKRGSLKECIKKRQIRYYGLVKVDKKKLDKIIEQLDKEKKKEKETKQFPEALKNAYLKGIRLLRKRTKIELEIKQEKDKNKKLKLKKQKEEINDKIKIVKSKISKLRNK